MPYLKTPGAGRVNNFDPAAQGAYGVKDHPTFDAINHVLSTPVTPSFLGTEGHTERFGTKVNVENSWGTPQSLTIAAKQLAGNKINRDIAKPEALAFDAGEPVPQQTFKPTAWHPLDENDVMPLWKQYQSRVKK